MKHQVPFCSCGDLSCPNHPSNHDEGCTLCILKNLEAGEIPSCFFRKVDANYHGPTYRMEDFARLVSEKKP